MCINATGTKRPPYEGRDIWCQPRNTDDRTDDVPPNHMYHQFSQCITGDRTTSVVHWHTPSHISTRHRSVTCGLIQRRTHMISLDIQTSYNLGQAGGDFSWTMATSTNAVSNDKNKSEQQRQQTTNISEDKSGDLSGD